MPLSQSELSRIANLGLNQVHQERENIQSYIVGREKRILEFQKKYDKTRGLSFAAGIAQQQEAMKTAKDYLRAYDVAEAILRQNSLT